MAGAVIQSNPHTKGDAMVRPEKPGTPVQTRLSEEELEALDEARRYEPDIPSRPEMLRRLMKEALAARSKKGRKRMAAELTDANDPAVTAVHEASHAVVQIAMKLGVARVEVARVIDGKAPAVLGRCADRCPELDRLKRSLKLYGRIDRIPDSAFGRTMTRRRARGLLHRYMVSIAAGPASDRLFWPGLDLTSGWSGDLLLTDEALAWLGVDGDEQSQVVAERAFARAKVLVARHRREIEAVADLLLERGRLDEVGVRAAMRAARKAATSVANRIECRVGEGEFTAPEGART